MLVAAGQHFVRSVRHFLSGAQIDVLVGVTEDVAVEMDEARIALDQILELAVGHFLAELLIGQTEEVIEAVAVH